MCNYEKYKPTIDRMINAFRFAYSECMEEVEKELIRQVGIENLSNLRGGSSNVKVLHLDRGGWLRNQDWAREFLKHFTAKFEVCNALQDRLMTSEESRAYVAKYLFGELSDVCVNTWTRNRCIQYLVDAITQGETAVKEALLEHWWSFSEDWQVGFHQALEDTVPEYVRELDEANDALPF